jgi:DNA repair protein RecO (recombination protein O)
MALEKSEAIILKIFNWSESSRTVALFTRDFGRMALIDKGGRSITSKRGRLLPFARLELTFYSSDRESSGYVRDCETLQVFSLEKEGTLGRLAYGSAACELLNLLLPEEDPQPSLYTYVITYFDHLVDTDRRALPSVFIAFLLRLMSHLGFRPSLAYCAGCRKGADEFVKNGDKVLFSPERGGVICPSCQTPGEYYISLPAEGVRVLFSLQTASLSEAASVALGYDNSALLLEALTKFLSFHAGVGGDLKSLEFLEKLKTSHLTG